LQTVAAQALRVVRHDSPLGQWSITTLTPHPFLGSAVRFIWHAAGRVAYSRDRILPGPRSYLLFNLGPPQYLIEAGPLQRRVVFNDVWYCGITERPIDTAAPHGSDIVGVELTPTGAALLFPWPLSELANHVSTLVDLIGHEAVALRERLLDCESTAGRLQLVHDWLLDRCMSGRQIHPLVYWATRRLAESAGTLRTNRLASEAGCSRKHLHALFSRDVGLAPGTLARMHRFQRALAEHRSMPARTWSDVAASCGYYDQAHLIRDFRLFAGLAPTALERLAVPDSASVVLG
jgi:AraC-like DNA-binding protein